MTYAEIMERRNKLMNDATNLARTANITAEQRTQVQNMLKDVDALEDDAKTAQRLEAFEAEQRSSTRPPRGIPGEQATAANTDEQKRAFRTFMVSGETRDLGTVTGGPITAGSQLIAPAFYPVLTQAQQSYGGLVNIVNQRTTDTGAPMKVSLVNDLANGLLTWPEDTAATEADPSMATTTSSTEMYNTGVILVTLEELQDSFFDIDAFIRDAFGQRLYRGLAKRISQGDGAAYTSLWSNLTSGATSASPNGLTYQDIAALYGSVDPAYSGTNSTWVMNSQTRALLMTQISSTGQPLFTVGGTTSGGPVDTILGRPVVLDQYAPSIGAGNTALAFGDFKAYYTLRNVGEFTIARDPYTFLVSKGAVAFIGYGRGGSFITDAGTHPVKGLTQHS